MYNILRISPQPSMNFENFKCYQQSHIKTSGECAQFIKAIRIIVYNVNEMTFEQFNANLTSINARIKTNTDKHNEFLKELGLKII